MSSVYCQRPLTPHDPGVITSKMFKLDSFYNGDYDKDRGEFRDRLWHCNMGHFGVITVLVRKTGYIGGLWDIESGYRESYSPWRHLSFDFWLASGGVDVMHEIGRREHLHGVGMHFFEVIAYIKDQANTCRGRDARLYFQSEAAPEQRDYMQYWQSCICGTNSPDQKAD